MSTICILVISPGEIPHPKDIPHPLESLQSIVGGDIEVIYPFDAPVGAVCHEFGKFIGLPLNRVLRMTADDSGKLHAILYGPTISE